MVEGEDDVDGQKVEKKGKEGWQKDGLYSYRVSVHGTGMERKSIF